MKKIFTVIFVLTSTVSFSQKQANIWYFGNYAGLDFNSGVPVVLTNSAMNQSEGVSSISEANGSLLFYTDGMTVWNSNHVPMGNGSGLLGNWSTSQSALIVKQPGSASLYYIFTLGADLDSNGFNYSIVDMSLNGGLGDVTVKNSFLYKPSTEKITAVNQANGFDSWIITHDYNNNKFQAYALTSGGFNSTPVLSSIGPVISSVDYVGYLKVSPDGHRLAMAFYDTNEFWLFDFDPITGVVTNPMLLSSPLATDGAYGVDFSPNSNVLYGSIVGTPINISQWDLSSGNVVSINASRVDLNPGLLGSGLMGSLSLAPDGKIYFSRTICNYLGSISNPNVVGSGCNLVDSAIYLMGKQCVYGLPNLNQSLYNSGFTFTGTCFGASTYFDIPNTAGLLGAQWDFNDPASGANNVSFVTNPVHVFTAPGNYNVTVLKFYAAYTDTVLTTVIINPLPVANLGPDTSFCAGNSFVFNAGSGYTSYLWQDNSTDSIFTSTLPGTYWVTISANGCSASDTVMLGLATCSVPEVNFISSDTTFCGKQCIDFMDLSTNNPTSWQWFFPGADSTFSTLQNPGNICYNSYGTFDVKLIACNAAGCDTLLIPQFITEYQLPAQPVISQGHDTLYSTPSYSYSWYNTLNPGVVISTNSYYVFSNGGSYFVIISDSVGCQNSSAVFVTTGIFENVEQESPFTISPNPMNDMFTIILNKSFTSANIELSVFDAIGKNIYKTLLYSHESSIKLSNAVNGIYFVQLKTSKGIFNKKIVVNH